MDRSKEVREEFSENIADMFLTLLVSNVDTSSLVSEESPPNIPPISVTFPVLKLGNLVKSNDCSDAAPWNMAPMSVTLLVSKDDKSKFCKEVVS